MASAEGGAGAAATASAAVAMQANWRMPQASRSLSEIWDKAFPLKMQNSLTRTKTTFVPMNGKRVLWYMCGPTVYDSAHMGHARTYISFDILRRIMSSYFGYDVLLTMNITDIDDKIIMRSNERGISFEALAREQEASFLADMERLGVLPPEVMTRVSEYVPEIISFVEKIIAKGFAYVSNGSVYFDVAAYSKDPKHTYGKLVPENVGNSTAAEEGEGALSAGAGDKRNVCDFALWKASKPGEPWWDSPWGHGRPGWHIECSAMCDDTLGGFAHGPIDIHSGGVDLRFPHHDNEIAQSEACYHGEAGSSGGAQWVNYFLHSGHLNIEGLKMSKSLKNFIKITDAIERYGARQLRLLFLQQKYNAPMNYSERQMEGVAATEKTFVEFFANAKAALRGLPPTVNQHWHAKDKEFASYLYSVKEGVRAALADDFNTPVAMSLLADLVRETNKYMAGTYGSSSSGAEAGSSKPVPLVLRASADYVSYMFRIFGLIDPIPSVGFSATAGAGAGGEGAGADLETTLAPYLDVLASFREQVRACARGGDVKGLLALCDTLRDEVLPPLGVKLEDGGAGGAEGGAAAAATGGTKWKLRSPEDMRREAEEKRAAADEKARKKAEAAAEAARKAAEKEEKAKQDPRTMFTGQTDKYSAFDADGVPTHDAAGAELPKATVKKLKKEWATQKKLNEWLLAKQSGGAAAADAEEEEETA